MNYKQKINKLSKVINQLGRKRSYYAPALVGVVEVENKTVLEDLIQTSSLKNEHYGIVHYNSPDERGIDVALLYKNSLINPERS